MSNTVGEIAHVNNIISQSNGVTDTQDKMKFISQYLKRSPRVDNPPKTYYGVYIPCELKIGPEAEKLHVYENTADALDVVKQFKKARFKSFKNHQEAVAFALKGTEPIQDREVTHNVTVINNTALVGERPSLFKGPKPQEMVAFRKVIESGDLNTVRKTIWDNPRYLISNGDTPSILQEGSRYNAVHIAVRSSNVEICELILSTINNPEFIGRLYGEDNMDFCKERAAILLDLYLNTPDKSINETPLHFASKLGIKEIVDLLVSYPQCIRNLKNKYGDEPKDIICQRKAGSPKLIAEIHSMFQDRFYVPVLHSEDNSEQPIIGEPFSPGSPCSMHGDAVSPRVEIRAFAGPMNKAEANTFRKKWKTPPRSLNNSCKTPLAAARFRLTDTEKGLERVGRDLAQQFDIGWKEYWPFLDTFTNLSSEEGLGLLEEHLKNEYISSWNDSSNDINSLQVTPKSVNGTISSSSPFELKMNANNTNENKSRRALDPDMSPMSGLCLSFQTLSLYRDKISTSPKTTKNFMPPRFRYTSINDDPLNDVSCEDKPFITNNKSKSDTDDGIGLNPYLCIEKSCHVFAKRLDVLLTENDFNIDLLKTEIKHLQQTISSYLDDSRFQNVEFQLIHSRVAQITALKLTNDNRIDVFKNILEISDLTEAGSSDDEEYFISNRKNLNRNDKERRFNNEIMNQIRCLARNILKWISNENLIPTKTLQTEDECINVWSNLYKCNCSWETEQFIRNCRKNASIKRNQMKSRDEILSTSPKTIDGVSKRLIFDNDHDTENTKPSPESDTNHNLANHQGNTINTETSDTFHDVIEELDNMLSNISDDDSEDDGFVTPLSSAFSDIDDLEFEDANEVYEDMKQITAIDVFIHGERPSKADKTAYDAISHCSIDVTKYPYVYRWKHTINLYSKEERERWPSDNSVLPDNSTITCSFNIGHISNFGSSTPTRKGLKNIYSVSMDESNQPKCPDGFLTPTKAKDAALNIQVSKWMRITGQNSPKSTLRNQTPNISLNF